jgi:hypothetical protein
MFHQIEKNPKICMKPQRTLNSQDNPEKEQSGDVILPDFKHATRLQRLSQHGICV